MKNKLSKFERNQSYIRSFKSDYLRSLTFKFRNELLDLETTFESIFKSYLIKLKVKFEFQKIIYAGRSFYIVDFYLPKYNIVVEIDGIHHSNFEKKEQDNIRTENLKKVGIKRVFRFYNNEVLEESRCFKKLRGLLK